MKPFALLAAFLLFSLSLLAQKAADIFDSKLPLVYHGIDFTLTKVLEESGVPAFEIKGRHFPGMNDVIVAESKKYDWGKVLRRTNISNDLSLVTERNKKIELESIHSLKSSDYDRLKISDIEKAVSEYEFNQENGIALVIFVEAFSKARREGAMYVTFIDMATKKIVHTERITGKSGGFGFRNYYSHCVLEVMEEIQSTKAPLWRLKFKKQ